MSSAVVATRPDADPQGTLLSLDGGEERRVERQPLSAFTVDVEDYFQVSGFERHIQRHQWDDHESRIVRNTQRMLRILERHNVHGTFFVLGWVAHRYPRLVREIDRAGHEIGTHSFWHRLIYEQTPAQFRADLRQSRAALEDVIGRPVTAHRAPSFSITQHSLWALDILVEEGFRVDSSIFPTHHDRYGIPQAEPRLHRLAVAAGSLWEFPPSVTRFGRIKVPLGGGYFRLYPLSWTLYCLNRIRNAGHPAMFYIHPWELDPEQPRLRAGTRLGRFRHYVNLASNERKLNTLLRNVRFGRICDVLAQTAAAACVPVLALENT
jgi:polysaccharide deacetylase family protein (PEP-CTERM system associated)